MLMIRGAGKACQVFAQFSDFCSRYSDLTLGWMHTLGYGFCPLYVK